MVVTLILLVAFILASITSHMIGRKSKSAVRSILHITVGDGNWEPTDPEFKEIKKSFTEALNSTDPVSVVTTRTGVYPSTLQLGATGVAYRLPLLVQIITGIGFAVSLFNTLHGL